MMMMVMRVMVTINTNKHESKKNQLTRESYQVSKTPSTLSRHSIIALEPNDQEMFFPFYARLKILQNRGKTRLLSTFFSLPPQVLQIRLRCLHLPPRQAPPSQTLQVESPASISEGRV